MCLTLTFQRSRAGWPHTDILVARERQRGWGMRHATTCPHHTRGLERGLILPQQPREQPQKTAPAADLEAWSPGDPLISLRQSTLVLTKQTEEIYGCLSLWRAPHSLLNESSSFGDHSHWDGEDVCFAPKKELWSCLFPSFWGWRGRRWAWREPLNWWPGALLGPGREVPFLRMSTPPGAVSGAIYSWIALGKRSLEGFHLLRPEARERGCPV